MIGWDKIGEGRTGQERTEHPAEATRGEEKSLGVTWPRICSPWGHLWRRRTSPGASRVRGANSEKALGLSSVSEVFIPANQDDAQRRNGIDRLPPFLPSLPSHLPSTQYFPSSLSASLPVFLFPCLFSLTRVSFLFRCLPR